MRVTEEKFKEKIKEVFKFEGEVEILKKKLLEKEYDIAHYQNRC